MGVSWLHLVLRISHVAGGLPPALALAFVFALAAAAFPFGTGSPAEPPAPCSQTIGEGHQLKELSCVPGSVTGGAGLPGAGAAVPPVAGAVAGAVTGPQLIDFPILQLR